MPKNQWLQGGDTLAAQIVAGVLQAVQSGNGATAGGARSAGWLCRQPDCNWAAGKWRNQVHHLWCQGCKRPKTEAVKVKGVPGAAPADTATKAEKKSLARARRRQARLQATENINKNKNDKDKEKEKDKASTTGSATPGPALPAPDPGTSDQASHPASPVPVAAVRLAVPAGVLESIPLLTDAITDYFKESLSQDTEPPEYVDRDPVKLMNKFIGERGPTAKISRNETTKMEIDKLKIAISALDGCDSQATNKAKLQADLDAKMKDLAKAEKDTPSADHEEKALLEARSSYEVSIQVRKDRAKIGMEKAATRKAARKQRFIDVKAQLETLHACITKMETDNDAKFAARIKEVEQLETKVLQLFDKKIADLKAASAASALAAAASVPVPAGQPAQPQGQQQTPGAPAAQVQDHMAELEALRSKVLTLTGQMTELNEASRRKTQFEMAFHDLSICDLPDLEAPTPAEVPAFEALFGTLDRWDDAGAAVPFNWDALAAVTKEIESPMVCFKGIFGNEWSKWYSEGEPHPSSVIPRQMVSLALKSLKRLNTKLAKMDIPPDAKKRAEEGLVAIKESAKKLRSA